MLSYGNFPGRALRLYERQIRLFLSFHLKLNSHEENLRIKQEDIGNYSNDRKQEFVLKRGLYNYTIVIKYY